jgi:enoyl-CoA hydratase
MKSTSTSQLRASRRAVSRFSTVIYEKVGAIAIVTLNRPEKFNAYNVAMRDDLHQILSALYDDPDLGAMVLMGAGSAFSTGGDVSEFGSAPSPTIARWVRFRRDVWGLLHRLPILTIAAVHGFTVGGGLEMALLCDLAIAAEDTRICLPESGLGMIPGVAGTQTAALRGGLAWGLDLSITGRWINAREAFDIGLITELVPRANLRARAIAVARRVSRLPRESVAVAKLAVWDGLDFTLREGLALERRLGGRLAALAPIT